MVIGIKGFQEFSYKVHCQNEQSSLPNQQIVTTLLTWIHI